MKTVAHGISLKVHDIGLSLYVASYYRQDVTHTGVATREKVRHHDPRVTARSETIELVRQPSENEMAALTLKKL